MTNNQTTIEIEQRDQKQVLDEMAVEDEAGWNSRNPKTTCSKGGRWN